MDYVFYTVDAFTDTRFQGAPILIFPQADHLDDTQMMQIAREFNFAETVFVQSPLFIGHTRRFRIFTPERELPFAGHPTIAAAYILAHLREMEPYAEEINFVIEEPMGPIQIQVIFQQDTPILTQFGVNMKYTVDGFIPPLCDLAAALSLEDADLVGMQIYMPLVITGSQRYLVVPMRDLPTLQRARFDFQAWLRSSATATLPTDLMLFTSAPERMHQEPTYQVRLVGPMLDPDQDPPIGSAVPALAAYLNEYRTKLDGDFHFIAERGVGQRRLSTLYVNAHRHHGHLGTIWVGGKVVLLSQGTLTL